MVGLAVEAATKALEMAEVVPEDIDLVLMCTSTPDDLFGAAPQVLLTLKFKISLEWSKSLRCLIYDNSLFDDRFKRHLVAQRTHWLMILQLLVVDLFWV